MSSQQCREIKKSVSHPTQIKEACIMTIIIIHLPCSFQLLASFFSSSIVIGAFFGLADGAKQPESMQKGRRLSSSALLRNSSRLLFSRSATTVRLSISLAYNCRKSPSSRFAPRYSLHFDFKADFGVTMKELITSITVHKQALCLRQRKEAAVVEVRSSPHRRARDQIYCYPFKHASV